MKKQILNIAPLQTAKIMAALWFVISLPFLLLIGVMMFTSPRDEQDAFDGLMLLLPVFYAISGFIFTLIGAWFYNMLAKRLGGIEYTTQDVE